MREIKFRAWHKDENAMLFAGDDYGTKNGIECCVYALQGQPVELMQYTGLKDKNGVEIYDGDIVRDHNGIGEVQYSEIKAAFKVNYRDGFAKWFIDYNLSGERESIEVIGNIYQNPELLNS